MKVFPMLPTPPRPRPADTVTCPVCRNYNVEATHCDSCGGKGYVPKPKPKMSLSEALRAVRDDISRLTVEERRAELAKHANDPLVQALNELSTPMREAAKDAERASALFDNGWELKHMKCDAPPHNMYAVGPGREGKAIWTLWYKNPRDAVDAMIAQKAKRDAKPKT